MVYCWKCGSELRDDSAYCYKCGASVKGTMGVQGPTGFELLGHDKTIQNHWAKRVIALIIDAAIVSVAAVVVSLVLAIPFLIGVTLPSGVFPIFPAWWAAWWGGIIPLIIVLYFVLAEGLYSRTIGKGIMGLRVERIDGRPMNLPSALVRNISKIYILLLILDVALGLGMHGEMSQKYSDRYIGTKVETVSQMTLIP